MKRMNGNNVLFLFGFTTWGSLLPAVVGANDFKQSLNLRQVVEKPQRKELSNLETSWYLSKPRFEYDGYVFDMEYDMGTAIKDTSISYEIYDSHLCGSGGANKITDSQDYLLSDLKLDVNVFDSSTGLAKLNITVVSEKIRATSLYEDRGGFSDIYFCVRFSAFHHEEGLAKPIEVNWVETPVILVMDDERIQVGSFHNRSGDDSDSVEAKLCDESGNSIEGNMVTVGQVVRICIEPAPGAQEDGGFLWYIEDFSFTRSGVTDETLSQTAIVPGSGGNPASKITDIHCEQGSAFCFFETQLDEEFFSSVGFIESTGTVFLQYGDIDIDAGQDHGMAIKAGPSKISLRMVAIPGDDSGAQSKILATAFFVSAASAFALVLIL